ncbi:hypothetical protein [Erythrobacter sp. EC-HK427]|uniref:hypothetical protein n=1 Tax=Erythrobacter sp. EC-HK427 TaxID=2038396 RepID=UPI0018FE4A15|nr:hypothetical protein [Erythrobacter sp. EC-HK427]
MATKRHDVGEAANEGETSGSMLSRWPGIFVYSHRCICRRFVGFKVYEVVIPLADA